MAAILGTSETITTYDVEQVAEVNVVGTVKMLKLCKKYGVGRVLIPTTPFTFTVARSAAIWNE